jgi:2-methylcitrate dehydratase
MDQALLLAMGSINDDGKAFQSNGRLSGPFVQDLEIDWDQEDLEAVRRTAIKKFNSEIHSQSALEAILYLRERQPCHPEQIERIELYTFDVAYNLLGGNAQGTEYAVRTGAEAYRSLPYLLAAALLDGEVTPAQYEPERFLREDLRSLMRKVVIRTDADFSRRFPEEMPARVKIFLRDGRTLTKENRDYEGYSTRPIPWERAVDKFKALTMFQTDYEAGQRIIGAVLDIEDIGVRELTDALAGIVKATKEVARENVFSLRKHKPAA